MSGVRLVVAVLLVVATVTACSSEAPPSAGPLTPRAEATTTTAPAPTTAAPAATSAERGELRFRKIGEFEQPVAFAVREGDDRMYVAEQTGRLRTSDGKTVIDLSGEVSGGNEQGLLGVAFHPSGRWVYLDWTDAQGHTHVTEWAYDGSKATGRRDVLTQDQPFANHNGGQLAFGPDGYLYIALGDGGGAGDPEGNGQDLGTLLGKILRIDPRVDSRGGRPYTVPEDNPFVGKEGAKTEIWAYGLRNPWRFTFDRDTGDLWIGDVGQNAWEEVDYQPAGSEGGENYGWNLREGDKPFRGGKGRELVDPVIVYPLGQDGNCSVIAGYVYRGEKIPWLQGQFLYGDFCAGWIKAGTVDELEKAAEVGKVEQLSSFGQGHDGELYALSLRGPLYRIEPA
ncbi:PQQ-dependent sugar dehydrogenase [Nonomuraea turkmeniaca]|uniref:PQQ-dependent sugar dehydrogenase n=1 Tax=Nonomuraea turkmeniaca TaxID=103838 RepID=A0A5S4FB47_9ACTN|nr:PQQ-dependent sugar dehydrogenase [Nonomuraea turkmeniaca]TMR14906.1 PQQ-dependent sugar dehydrogenase [Nonomuraea turkmeniaca]